MLAVGGLRCWVWRVRDLELPTCSEALQSPERVVCVWSSQEKAALPLCSTHVSMLSFQAKDNGHLLGSK